MEPNKPVTPAPHTPPAPTAKASNAFGVTALILGIVAFCLGWTGPIGLIVAIAAVVFGILALVKKQSKGMGITGLILGSLALITALIVTLVGAAFIGGVGQVANEVTNEQKALDEVKKDFAKGETATFDKLAVKVNTFTPSWQPTDGFSTPKDGYEYVYVSLNIKNTGDEDESVNPFDFKINDNGVVADHEIASTPTPLNAVDLKAGSAIDGDLVFQVKKGATNLKLQYKTFNSKALKEVTYSLAL